MKIWLDDYRNPPTKNWVQVKNVEEFKTVVLNNKFEIEEISFDYELEGEETGYDAIKWLEHMILTEQVRKPRMLIHTGSPLGAKEIMDVVNSIQKH